MRVYFPMTERNVMQFQFMKKSQKISLKTIDL